MNLNHDEVCELVDFLAEVDSIRERDVFQGDTKSIYVKGKLDLARYNNVRVLVGLSPANHVGMNLRAAAFQLRTLGLNAQYMEHQVALVIHTSTDPNYGAQFGMETTRAGVIFSCPYSLGNYRVETPTGVQDLLLKADATAEELTAAIKAWFKETL